MSHEYDIVAWWEGWDGVRCRIEDQFHDALVAFGYALGELS